MNRQRDEHELLDFRFRNEAMEDLGVGAAGAGHVAPLVQLAVLVRAVLGKEAVDVPVDERAHGQPRV